MTRLISVIIPGMLALACNRPEACIEAEDRFFQNVRVELESCGTAETFFWDFGDGEGAEGRRVEHSFDTTGEHVVEQIALRNDGRKEDRAVHVVTTGYKQIDSVVVNRLALSVWSNPDRGPNLYLTFGNFRSVEVFEDFRGVVSEADPLKFTFEEDTRILQATGSDGWKVRDENDEPFQRDMVLDSNRTTNALEDIHDNPQFFGGDMNRSNVVIYWSLVR